MQNWPKNLGKICQKLDKMAVNYLSLQPLNSALQVQKELCMLLSQKWKNLLTMPDFGQISKLFVLEFIL